MYELNAKSIKEETLLYGLKEGTDNKVVPLEADEDGHLIVNATVVIPPITISSVQVENKAGTAFIEPSTEDQQILQLAELEDINTAVTSLETKDFATEVTLAALSAKVTACDTTDLATELTLASTLAEIQAVNANLADLIAKDYATESTLGIVNDNLQDIKAIDFATEVTSASILLQAGSAVSQLTTLNAKDFATEVTSASILLQAGSAVNQLITLNANVATETTLQSVNSSLMDINAKDFATETTLAALSAKVTACNTTDLAQEGTLSIVNDNLQDIKAIDFATEATLTALSAKITTCDTTDLATEATLASLEAKDFATEATLGTLSDKVIACDTTNLATETTLEEVVEIENQINQKFLPADCISYLGTDLLCELHPTGAVISWDSAKILFWGPWDQSQVSSNAACLVSDTMDYSKATRVWYTHNIDDGATDNWQILIDNSKLVKGTAVNDYANDLGGQTLYVSKIETLVNDPGVRELLQKWTLINDQSYDNCQKIRFVDGGCTEISSAPTSRRQFRILRTKLGFTIDDADTLFGVVFISGDGSPITWAERFAVGVGGQLIFDTVFTVDPDDTDYIVTVCTYANKREMQGNGELPDKTAFPDNNAVFFIGIPQKAAQQKLPGILYSVRKRVLEADDYEQQVLTRNANGLPLTIHHRGTVNSAVRVFLETRTYDVSDNFESETWLEV